MAPVVTDTTFMSPTLISAIGTTSQGATLHAGAELSDFLLEDLLIEEISIDGMCGVY